MDDHGSAPPPTPPPQPASGFGPMLQMVKGLLQELPGLFNDRMELLALELERARDALLQVAVLSIAAAVLGVTSWLALWAVVILGLMALGLGLPWAMLVVLGVNVLSTWWVMARVRRLLPRLGLPATRRHLLMEVSAPEPHGLAPSTMPTPSGSAASAAT